MKVSMTQQLNYQKVCLYFTFSGLLQQELDMWNNHCIRNSREAECPGGNPDVLYYTPSQSGDIECKLPLNHTDLELVKQNTEYPDFPGYTPELQEIAGTVMAEQNINLPDNCEKSKRIVPQVS